MWQKIKWGKDLKAHAFDWLVKCMKTFSVCYPENNNKLWILR